MYNDWLIKSMGASLDPANDEIESQPFASSLRSSSRKLNASLAQNGTHSQWFDPCNWNRRLSVSECAMLKSAVSAVLHTSERFDPNCPLEKKISASARKVLRAWKSGAPPMQHGDFQYLFNSIYYGAFDRTHLLFIRKLASGVLKNSTVDRIRNAFSPPSYTLKPEDVDLGMVVERVLL